MMLVAAVWEEDDDDEVNRLEPRFKNLLSMMIKTSFALSLI